MERIARQLILLLLTCLVPGNCQAEAQIPVTLSIANSPGFAVPEDFAGLSFEIGTQRSGKGGIPGCIFSPSNKALITLFTNIGIRRLRIGGGTVDGPRAASLNHSEIDRLFGFAQAANLKVIYSLRLLNGDPMSDAATARYVWTHYRSMLDSFAIGNEPDWRSYSYRPHGKGEDPSIVGYQSYLADWRRFAAAVAQAAPGARFCGPDTGNNFDEGPPDNQQGFWAHNGTEWTTDFARDESSSHDVILITQHDYEASHQKPTPPPTNAAKFINAMLSMEWNTVTNQVLFDVMAAPVLAMGWRYRFTEANEIVYGVAGASRTMASALWALDFMHWWAAHRCAGIDFHNKPWLLTDTIYFNPSTQEYEVTPKAYAIKAFVLGSGGKEVPVEISDPKKVNLTAYAIAGRSNLWVTIINKEHGASGRAVRVTVQVPGFSPSSIVKAMSLTDPGGAVEATNGVTLRGAIITNNAPWNGRWSVVATMTSGTCLVTVPASSAVLLEIMTQD